MCALKRERVHFFADERTRTLPRLALVIERACSTERAHYCTCEIALSHFWEHGEVKQTEHTGTG